MSRVGEAVSAQWWISIPLLCMRKTCSSFGRRRPRMTAKPPIPASAAPAGAAATHKGIGGTGRGRDTAKSCSYAFMVQGPE